ncbi:MAG: hypothetical protein PWQ32_1438 [Thermococcaceae archaeon]|jgi:hypothetical protein|nr:hypothetical protein [Thermococcaceae archaeon]MDK2982569.1 hypothetical protein [Thermococcaceae archaeon]
MFLVAYPIRAAITIPATSSAGLHSKTLPELAVKIKYTIKDHRKDVIKDILSPQL